MAAGAIKTVTADVGLMVDGVMFTTTMAVKVMNESAASVEAGGVCCWRWCEVQNGGSSMLGGVSARIMLCAERSS